MISMTTTTEAGNWSICRTFSEEVTVDGFYGKTLGEIACMVMKHVFGLMQQRSAVYNAGIEDKLDSKDFLVSHEPGTDDQRIKVTYADQKTRRLMYRPSRAYRHKSIYPNVSVFVEINTFMDRTCIVDITIQQITLPLATQIREENAHRSRKLRGMTKYAAMLDCISFSEESAKQGTLPPRPVIQNRMKPVFVTEGATNPTPSVR